MFRHFKTLFIVLACLTIVGSSFAQVNTTTGTISGVVTDNNGGALPGVTISISNTETGLSRTGVTEADGTYNVSLLPPGQYRVEAQLAGLGKAAQPNVTVRLGEATSVKLKITPQVTEQITVTAATPIVDTQRSGTTASVSNQQIESLPILGRDFRSLAALTPGITLSSFDGTITANGARGLSTDFNIDGANSDNDFFGQQTGGTPPPFTFPQAAINPSQLIRTHSHSPSRPP